MSLPILGRYEETDDECGHCEWLLYVDAANDLRFCMYCGWHESDLERLCRLNPYGSEAQSTNQERTESV